MSTLAGDKVAADAKLRHAEADLIEARKLVIALLAPRAADRSRRDASYTSSGSGSQGVSDAEEALRSLGLEPEADYLLDNAGDEVVYHVPAAACHKLSNLYVSKRGVEVGAVSPPVFICDPTAGETLSSRLLPAVWEGGDVPAVGLHGLIPLQQSIKSTIETMSVNTSDRNSVPADLPPWKSVEDIFRDLIDPLYQIDADDVTRVYRATLRALRVPLLSFTPDSSLDIVTAVSCGARLVPLSVVELKSSSRDLLEGLGQATQGATCVAAGLVQCGVAWQDVTVSFMVCNGHAILFGGVHLVAPSLPMPYVTSSPLSLLDYKQAFLAHRHMVMHNENTQRLACAARLAIARASSTFNTEADGSTCAAVKRPVFSLRVPCDVYCKPNVIRVACKTPHGQRVSTWDASVTALQAVYSQLYSCGARDVVVFPFGIVRGLRPARASVRRLKNDRALLLPNLLHADPPFSPAPPCDFEDAWAFVDAVEEAVRLVHKAGVVHGDLYLSNIFHRRLSGNFQVKFIDWDTGFFSSASAPPSCYRLTTRILYTLCQQQQIFVGSVDAVALNCTLDWAEVYAMRLCLLDEDGFEEWRQAAQLGSPADLNKLSRYMERLYDRSIYGKSYANAVELARRTKAAGDARAGVAV